MNEILHYIGNLITLFAMVSVGSFAVILFVGFVYNFAKSIENQG